MSAEKKETAITALKDALGPKGWSDDAQDMAPRLVEERGLYHGSSPLLVRPANTDEVSKVMALCHEAGLTIVPQGGNTGLVGGGVPDGDIILSLERMNRVLDVDPVNLTLSVEAGCVLANVQEAALEAGAFFPLSLGAEGSCQIGGNLSTNAGGVQVLRYGNARDLVLGLEVVLADGRVWNGLKALRKDNTGYDLKQLFLGAEGTLGVITRAVLRLFPKPKVQATALVGCKTYADALALFVHVRDNTGERLTACEAMSRFCMDLSFKHMEGCRDPFQEPHGVYVLLELSAADAGANLDDDLEAALAEAMESGLVDDAVIAQSETQRDELWRLREAIPEAQKKEGASIKHDVSVPVAKVADFIDAAIKLVEAALPGVRPAPFGHLGDGNIHFNLTQPAGADAKAFLAQWDAINRQVHDLAVAMGGSFSAEHGIGKLKMDALAHYKSPVEMDLMRALKRALDPTATLNPGKVLGRDG